MMFPWTVGLGAIAFTATFVLSFHDAVASEDYTEGNRQLQECTEHDIARCYMYSTSAVEWDQLKPNENGEFNEEAYRKACRVLNETSPCYEGSSRCPASMRSNFTRREEGYRTFRALVCDTEVLKGDDEDFAVTLEQCYCRHRSPIEENLFTRERFGEANCRKHLNICSGMVTGSTCTNKDNLQECIRNQLSSFNSTGVQYEELHCRVIDKQRPCFNKSWNSSCPISLESAWEIFNKTTDATELINDCQSMYLNASNAANATGSKEVTLSDLAADVGEVKVLLRENAQAIASLTNKVKENAETLKRQAASMESFDGALHALRGEFRSHCRTHPDDPERSQA